MRRQFAILSIVTFSMLLLLCAGALRPRLFDLPINASDGAKFTVFDESDISVDVTNAVFYPDGYERVDCLGGIGEAMSAIDFFAAEVVEEEQLGDELVVFYAYSHKFARKVTLECGTVNIMIAVNKNSGGMVLGYPLIKGSF